MFGFSIGMWGTVDALSALEKWKLLRRSGVSNPAKVLTLIDESEDYLRSQVLGYINSHKDCIACKEPNGMVVVEAFKCAMSPNAYNVYFKCGKCKASQFFKVDCPSEVESGCESVNRKGIR
jgi:hypothetical protein